MKQQLKQDLIADGLRPSNFTQRHTSLQPLVKSPSNHSPVLNRKLSSNYYTLKTQRELIVEHPNADDVVADVFHSHWKLP